MATTIAIADKDTTEPMTAAAEANRSHLAVVLKHWEATQLLQPCIEHDPLQNNDQYVPMPHLSSGVLQGLLQ